MYKYSTNIILYCLIITTSSASDDYWNARAKLVAEEQANQMGMKIVLNPKELEVNKILMELKLKELDDGFKTPEHYLPAIHFFESKQRIESSEVFKFIKALPKGGSLHSHDIALCSGEYVYNLTFRENLYGCVKDSRLYLQFFGANVNDKCDWELVSELRKKNSSFDDFLKTQISIVVDDPATTYPDINDAWLRFQNTFETVGPMLCYKEVWQDYFYQALQELYDDNVMYIEFRSTLPLVYDLNGTVYGPVDVAGLYYDTLKAFMKNNPAFLGGRLIYAPNRDVSNLTMHRYMTVALKLKQIYPKFLAGFDLVGQEDLGKPLKDFVPQLLELSKYMRFFFHAGETNWNGMTTDMNLIDAVLLNATRIGHGYDLLKHPQAMKLARSKKIAIEINPISNQVLKLVDDLRNHPASVFMNQDFPLVVCCDDPSFFGSKGLSYDWYLAFMGMASRQSDLRFLKQLALNSLEFSVMESVEKQQAYVRWQQAWDRFLDNVLYKYSSKLANDVYYDVLDFDRY